jgi:hypothetical protein
MKAFARSSFLAALGLAAALLPGACQSQGVGEHCDKQNGNADCASDLICGDSLVCCVPMSAQCIMVTSTGTAGTSVTADAAASDAGSESMATSEAATETAATTDAPSETTTTSGEAGMEGSASTSDAAADAAVE